MLAQRIADLQEQFLAQPKRTGGDRTTEIAQTWATILARREMGESLWAIAIDLEMHYKTVKTYAKLARQALTHTKLRSNVVDREDKEDKGEKVLCMNATSYQSLKVEEVVWCFL